MNDDIENYRDDNYDDDNDAGMSGNSRSQIVLNGNAWFSCSQTVGELFGSSRSRPNHREIFLKGGATLQLS